MQRHHFKWGVDMWVIGTYGILKNPDVIYAEENENKLFDIFAENEVYERVLERDVKKSDLKKIMLRIDFSLQTQEMNYED